MKTITTTIAVCLSLLTFAGNSGYTEAMETALTQFGASKTVEEYQNTANTFHRISSMAADEWLPEYYEAHCYIMMSFRDKNANDAKKDEYLSIAETAINSILTKQPKNDEAFALQALLYTAGLVIDPMTRGREYSIKSMGSIKTAIALNPTNPRALYLELSNEVGTANFFGEDTSKYCERINNLHTNWDSYNKAKPLHPSWGKGQVTAMAKGCTPTNDTNTMEKK